MRYVEPVFRPPSEARSLLIQATVGCSNNTCAFCGSNLTKKFSVRPLEDIEEDLTNARACYGEGIKRIFLLDANAMCMKTDDLVGIINLAYALFPCLERVGLYACSGDILEKEDGELEQLYNAGLKIAYLGMESGDDEVLRRVHKGVGSKEIGKACKKIMDAGITLSITIILGLGGLERWKEHAIKTAEVLGIINPEYIGALTLMVVPGTPLYRQVKKGEFKLLNSKEILHEMRLLVENLNLSNSVFRSNHASNYLQIGGTLPQDKEEILKAIDSAIESKIPLRPEFSRAL